MRRRSFMLACVLLALLAVAMAGCGRSRATPTPEPVTVTFAYRQGIAEYEPLANEFRRLHPEIEIQLRPINQARGGLNSVDWNEVDVIRWGQDFLTPQRMEQILPLDEILRGDINFPFDDMVDHAMEGLRVQGIQWGIPAGVDFAVAYYDAMRFKIAHATPPTADWTLDEFLIAASSVHNTEKTSAAVEFTYGFCSEPEAGDPIYFTYLFGGRLFDRIPDATRPTLNEPENIEAIQWYTDLNKVYGVMPTPEELRKAFPRGRRFEAIVRSKCGLWLGQYSDRGGKAWGFEWQGEGVMLPLPRVRTPFTALWVDGYYIMATSPHRREAWEWVRFLLEYEAAAGQMMPPRRSQVHSSAYATRVGEEIAAIARDLPPNAVLIPANPDPILEQVTERYIEAVTQVLAEDVSVESALDAAQIDAEALFASGEP
ncbi:MAG: hypothetical protein Kow0047_08270 [Anaerolineae bacterium]